jgi:predicted nucleic-acid-binding protein
MAALDTNVLLRFLLQDDAAQSAIATRLIRRALEAGETLYVPVSVALELEWVLRSRFKLDKAAVAQTFAGLLQTVELQFEATAALEWALSEYENSAADFSDCIHAASALSAGEQPLWTFDKAAAVLHGAAELK